MTTTVDLVAEARAMCQRVDARRAYDEFSRGALLIDIRPQAQREVDGEVPGALVLERNVLEWRLDPVGRHRIERAGPGVRVILLCKEGYATSLAAATLCRLGVDATDVVDGIRGWIEAGLPVVRSVTPAGEYVTAAISAPTPPPLRGRDRSRRHSGTQNGARTAFQPR